MSNKQKGIVGTPGPSYRRGGGFDGFREGTHEAVNVGHGNFVLAERIVAILESGSLPMKRLRERAAEENMLVDATAGRKTRSVVVTDSRHVVLSALAPATLHERLQEMVGVGGRVSALSAAQREREEGEFVS